MNIDRLTPEQEALIPVYREKWLKIATSTASLDYQKARKAVKATYKIIGRKEPIIIFVKSPAAAWRYIVKHSMPLLEDEKIIDKLRIEMSSVPLMKISSQIGNIFKELSYLGFDLNYYMIKEQIMNIFNYESWKEYFYKSSRLDFEVYFYAEWSPDLGTSDFVLRSSLIDYCISVLDCNHDIKIWNTY